MTKIITLEKGDDGVYVTSGVVEEVKPEVKQEESINVERVKEQLSAAQKQILAEHKRLAKNRKANLKAHKFIADHGDKASEFLKGIQTSVTIFNSIKKLMK